jgi:hypothetical protein
VNETLDQRLRRAVDAFWRTREAQLSKQVKAGRKDAGARGAVTGGAQMAEIEKLVVELLLEAGLDRIQIKTRTALELPGYFRPEKRWDLLVIADRQLVAAIEFKSQVGSFGNNFNNRTEEAIGNAKDLWTAFREGRFGKPSPPAPFLGFFFLLEDCDAVHKPVKNSAPHFGVDPVFDGDGSGVSYAKRYEILLRRLLLERLYTAGCLTLSAKPSDMACATVAHPAEDLSFKRFADALYGHAVSVVRSRSG